MAKQVNVIMGGPSVEHEVSLATGWEMLTHLDTEKYTVRTVVITSGKSFYYTDTSTLQLSRDDLFDPEKSQRFKGPFLPGMSEEIWHGCDVALLALHGEFGEDGTFQGFLETLGIPYTGSGVFASAVGMNKIASKYLYEKNGMLTPPSSIYCTNGEGATIDEISNKHGYPCFVKCPQSGSSRLLGRADSREQLEKMIHSFSAYTSEILVESDMKGDEYSCPILEYPSGDICPLPPILIKPVRSEFFDFTAKYSEGECEEIVPAPCSAELTQRMQKVALQAHTVLTCSGISRTDMIVSQGEIYILETNTLPGFTSTSLVPKAFVALGGTYGELLDILIQTGIGRGD